MYVLDSRVSECDPTEPASFVAEHFRNYAFLVAFFRVDT